MAEHTNDFADGTVCEICGTFFDDVINGEEPPGYPRMCYECSGEEPDDE